MPNGPSPIKIQTKSRVNNFLHERRNLAIFINRKQNPFWLKLKLVLLLPLTVVVNMANHRFDRDQSRAKWTAASTKIFADLLVEQIQQGNRSNNVFNKKAWKYIQAEFNKQTSLKFDRQQLKNHLDVLRKRYNLVKALLEHAAEEDVWLKHIKAHPAAEPIKRNGCPIYKQLCIVFNESGSDDKCALSDSVKAIHEVVQEQSRAKWTTSLEKVFTNLMLEQVLQGNRSNSGFTKKAWKWIREEFSRKTGVRFGKQQLKNRHSVLRRLYSSIKWLLEQNGFT
ncbi:L10-interacting MYB domain-containing protein-like [Tripterygium wilfordii]|uniref:L10-interacting MYB domain-containing protein-like n=1 Tax=Tripterygium wilfordii TaxID=458696 RepID=UPI0018F834A2|nr:L10-interacting MYB domain-containing protein-like [Tripterygium wilfordii]